MRASFVSWLLVLSASSLGMGADDHIYSGPQVGERMSGFKVRGLFDANAGKTIDFVAQAAGKPIVLVFIHDANRLALKFTSDLTTYTHRLAADGLTTGVVWLTDDVTEVENFLQRTRYALNKDVPTGISLDGKEGPGSYGLNRNATLTIIVAKDSRVTANFALIQPSLRNDVPKILTAIAETTARPAATLHDLLIVESPKLQVFLSRLVLKDAKPEAIDQEARNIEELVKQDASARDELGRLTTRLLAKKTLLQHGTSRAQEYLHKWSRMYAARQE
jgi:hypothetical protein